jgi:flavoprotein
MASSSLLAVAVIAALVALIAYYYWPSDRRAGAIKLVKQEVPRTAEAPRVMPVAAVTQPVTLVGTGSIAPPYLATIGGIGAPY